MQKVSGILNGENKVTAYLICARLLHYINVIHSKIEPLNLRLKSSKCFCKIDFCPSLEIPGAPSTLRRITIIGAPVEGMYSA